MIVHRIEYIKLRHYSRHLIISLVQNLFEFASVKYIGVTSLPSHYLVMFTIHSFYQALITEFVELISAIRSKPKYQFIATQWRERSNQSNKVRTLKDY